MPLLPCRVAGFGFAMSAWCKGYLAGWWGVEVHVYFSMFYSGFKGELEGWVFVVLGNGVEFCFLEQ